MHPRASLAAHGAGTGRGEGQEEGPALEVHEVHGCLLIGGPDLESTTYPGGPTLVRGVRALVDDEGNEVQLTRSVVAICRCGKSQLHPFCDGTHRFVPDFDGPA